MSTIPVICDRCRSTGFAGEADFSHLGDLLDFTPVPRKKVRVDGWSAEKQRAYIAALAATGSKRRATMAIGMTQHGADQLLKAEGSDSFKAAVERAMAIARQNGTMKIAQGIADVAARNAQMTPPSRLRGLPAPDDGEERMEMSEDQKWDLIHNIGLKFMRKVAAERQARLAGEIVAADFYLRQVTMIEVILDLTASEFGWDGREVLQQLRRDGTGVRQICSTPLADWLDRSRRMWWAQEGEPDRPPHPDVRFLKRHTSEEGDYATAAQMYAGGWTDPPPGVAKEEWEKLDRAGQEATIARIQQEDAEAQREWEAAARREFEEWWEAEA